MITWHTSETDNTRVYDLCWLAEGDHRPAVENMQARSWQDNPNTLLYKLHTEKLYDTGGYGIVSDDSGVIAGGGWHQMSWHPDIYYIGNRTYTVPGKNHTLPQNLLWEQHYRLSKRQGAKIILGSFNSYNRRYIERGIAINDPENHPGAFQSDGEWYRAPGKLLLPLKTIDHSVSIAHTEQWIFYHVIDPDFESEFIDISDHNRYGRIIN